jgi:NADH-quinone oxidoreductase subunit C
MSKKALELLQARFGDAVLATGSQHGDEWARVRPDVIAEVAAWMKSDPAMDMRMLVDVTAADYLEFEPGRRLALDDPQRFEVVYHFYSVALKHRLRIKVRCGGSEMTVPSLTGVYKTADWWERGVWDFYGVRFAGHPNLKRMWTYEEFRGHPLRKDYPVHQRQPLTPERHVADLVRGPGPGPSSRHSPFSQRPGARPNTKSDAYD